MYVLEKEKYQPRHAKPYREFTRKPTVEELAVADCLDVMREDLMARNFKEGHRRGAVNWFVYCLALRDVAALLRRGGL
jgi:hypothetical protein